MIDINKGIGLLPPNAALISPEISMTKRENFHFLMGVHTIELSGGRVEYKRLPDAYQNAIDSLGNKKYRVNIPRLRGMGEYNSVSSTQRAVNEVMKACVWAGMSDCVLSRVDFRFDDYEHAYSENLDIMLIFVNLIAFVCGIFDRVRLYSKGNKVITSVRAMPDETDKDAQFGIEYYDKENQKGTQKYGRARLELRRLNLHNESVAFVVREWKQILDSVTRKQYRDMLNEHAKQLMERWHTEESSQKFMKRIRPDLLSKEEEGILLKQLACDRNHYYCTALPRWDDVQRVLGEISQYLGTAINSIDSSELGEN